MTQTDIQQAVESIWALFRETDRRLDQQSRETDRQIKEMREQFQETDRRFKETDQRLDRITAETQREIATLSKQIRATEGLFTGQWGRLTEALVRPGVVRLFQVGHPGQPHPGTGTGAPEWKGDGARPAAGERRGLGHRGGQDHHAGGPCAGAA